MQKKFYITAVVTICFFLAFLAVRCVEPAKNNRVNSQPRTVAEFELKASQDLCDNLPEVAEPVSLFTVSSVGPHSFSSVRRTSSSPFVAAAFIASRAPPLATAESV